jgi:hypothetical protein
MWIGKKRRKTVGRVGVILQNYNRAGRTFLKNGKHKCVSLFRRNRVALGERSLIFSKDNFKVFRIENAIGPLGRDGPRPWEYEREDGERPNQRPLCFCRHQLLQ